MKINYYNENDKKNKTLIFICVLLMLFGILFCIYHSKEHIDIGFILFCGIWNLLLGILLLFLVKQYKKYKEQRNMNLFIMQQGECIKGKIISIYDNYIEGNTRGIHNVTAKIAYTIHHEEKIVVVDRLCIPIKHIKKYENKIVDIYIYKNMNYIDIVN
jgi:hypothetical protein